MAEGGGARYHAERMRGIDQGLDGFDKAVKKLVGIGLTKEAAILQAGRMFDLELDPSDIARPGKAVRRRKMSRR